MTRVTLECLACGDRRDARAPLVHSAQAGVCRRCGYVGWAPSSELTEDDRRDLRDLPVERRRLARSRLAASA